MTETPNLYRVLGVRKNATAETIEKAYSRRAKETHPDRGGEQADFEQVHLAYCVLSSASRRAAYDADGSTGERVDDSFQHAMRLLTGLLVNVFQQVIEQGGKIEEEDIVGHMRSLLQNERNRQKKMKADFEKVAVALKAAVPRLSVNPGPNGDQENLLAGIVAHKLTEVDGQLANLATLAGHLQKAESLLADYSYRVDQRTWVAGVPAGMWAYRTMTTTSTS